MIKTPSKSGTKTSDAASGRRNSASSTRSGNPNKALVGMIVIIGSELMFFSGLISSYLILKAGNAAWPPPLQPRLPVLVTGLNTLILLASAFAMHFGLSAIRKGKPVRMSKFLVATALLGFTFLFIQGSEWMRLISYGLTFTSSIYGATFYVVIGCHAVHVLGGLVGLMLTLKKAFASRYTKMEYTGVELCSMYWYFVVGIWPVLYLLVYLG